MKLLTQNIEKNIGWKLPVAYKDMLLKSGGSIYINFNEFPDEFPDDDGTSWFLWSLKQLNEPATINGAGTAPTYCQLSIYTKLDEAIRKRDYCPSSQGPIPHARVSQGFCIAESDGDLLYLDPSDSGSVWHYFHDSGETKRVANSFDAWIAKARFDVESS